MGDEEVDDEVEDEEGVSNDIHVACPSLPGLIFCFTNLNNCSAIRTCD